LHSERNSAAKRSSAVQGGNKKAILAN